jgi:dihydrofolate reductase
VPCLAGKILSSIGGSHIYQAFLPVADRIYLTRVQADIDGDTFLPDINAGEWRETSRVEHAADDSNDFVVVISTLER